MIPRDGALASLGRFLNQHVKDNNNKICFAFENKYYQQIRGGAMGSPFTMTLANIYMFEWEQPLIEYQKCHHELYGRYVWSAAADSRSCLDIELISFYSFADFRYIDDVFMTTNAFDQINIQLNRMEKKDENIRITRSIGTTVEFLDVLLTNDHGKLKTSVYHKPAAEPYILPYLSEHPRSIHRNVIIAALFRAIRLCSNIEDFDRERLHIELTLLLNGYPLAFITHHFKNFLKKHHVTSLLEQLDQKTFQLLHYQLLFQPSRRGTQNSEISTVQRGIPEDSPIQTINVHFTFESGPMSKFQRELRLLWKKYYIYKGSPVSHVRLQIGTRSNKSRCQLFMKKKLPKHILTNIPIIDKK
jgi:hypothetical protein